MTTDTLDTENSYRIGAVARLTGIAPDTLRIWERRYQLVEPQRTEKGGRLYSQDDVNRLSMVKTLVDQGHAIGSIAHLSNEELGSRLSHAMASGQPVVDSADHPVCLVGKALAIRAQNAEPPPQGVRLAGSYATLDDFLADECACATLVMEFHFLDRDVVHQLSDPELSTRCDRLIVIYGFAPSSILKQLKRLQVRTQRAPVEIEQLWQLCTGQTAQPVSWTATEFDPDNVSTEAVPKRLFSNSQLAELSQISTTLNCECPHHMSDIIKTLVAFEQYSAQCEVYTRQDAALHSYLHVMTAKSRSLMEIALQKLAEVEGIDLDALPR